MTTLHLIDGATGACISDATAPGVAPVLAIGTMFLSCIHRLRLGGDGRTDVLILRRHRLTAEPIGAPTHPEDDLYELTAGELEALAAAGLAFAIPLERGSVAFGKVDDRADEPDRNSVRTPLAA